MALRMRSYVHNYPHDQNIAVFDVLDLFWTSTLNHFGLKKRTRVVGYNGDCRTQNKNTASMSFASMGLLLLPDDVLLEILGLLTAFEVSLCSLVS